MQRLLTLLEKRNHYLEKFYSLNEKELQKINSGIFESLENFYQNRESILEVIHYIDLELDKLNIEGPFNLSDAEKHSINENLKIKNEFVTRILQQDFDIMSKIETAKSKIIRELTDLKSSRKAISGYKSKISRNRLDEEV